MRLSLSPTPLQVWAVEDTSIQLTWGHLPAGPVTATCRQARTVVDHPGGPGALDLTGLLPLSDLTIEVTWSRGRAELEARTLAPPPGELLCRVATVSDLHLGSTHFGATKLMRDRSHLPAPFPLRCARAAIDDAEAWGADLLVVKGDAAHQQRASDYEQLGRLLDDHPALPVLLIPGNHDVNGLTDHPIPAKVGERGVPYVLDVAAEDLDGIRVVVGNTTIPRRGHGTIGPVADALHDLVADSPGPWLLALHHHLQPHRVSTHYPPGVAGPASVHFLDRLVTSNPRGLVTAGHTHRNRRRHHGPLVLTEVGSTRDWPGVWAGYAVHEGGIRQVVRRVSGADAMGWIEYTHRALLGWWETWAQGPRNQRCFSHPWA